MNVTLFQDLSEYIKYENEVLIYGNKTERETSQFQREKKDREKERERKKEMIL